MFMRAFKQGEGGGQEMFLGGYIKTVPDPEQSLVRHGYADIFRTMLYRFSHSFSQLADDASLGMLQSPRGERLHVPTFGPSGRQERLNC